MENSANLNVEVINWENATDLAKKRICSAIFQQKQPLYLAYPQKVSEIAETVKLAQEKNWAILPFGNGSKLNWGGLVEKSAIAISSQHLNSLIDHPVGDLTVTVEAGMKLADLQSLLAQEKQFLPIDPSYPETATIGGIIATADTGSWRQRYGSIRDLILGITFVRADGEIAKAGGRVVKNVAGYDLMKLFTGSYGTLGIISQVTLRVYPQQASSQSLILTGDTEKISQVYQTLLASTLTPTAIDLFSPRVGQKLGIGTELGIAVRFQSVTASVKEQVQILSAMAEKVGLEIIKYQDKKESEFWQQLSSLFHSSSPSDLISKFGTLPTSSVKLLAESEALAIIHGKSGLGKLKTSEIEIVKQTRNYCQLNKGFLTLLESPPEVKENFEPWGYTGNAIDIMKKIKQQFDPNNLLSPGRFVGGI